MMRAISRVSNLSQRGFTLVELLIVIVVIAILAAVSIVAYNGIQHRALNTARLAEVKQWRELFALYYSENGQMPDTAAGYYCLGSGFPDGDGSTGGECRDYKSYGSTAYHEADNTSLMNELKTVGSLPNGPRKPVNDTIGPYVPLWPYQTGYTIYDTFDGGAGDCQPPTEYSWDDGSGRLICEMSVAY